ncbi:MAG: hypothetical protein ACKPEY_11480 [Planctomycetota bacterium]
MLDENDKQLIKLSVRALQIIVVALAVGVSAFTLYTIYSLSQQNGPVAEKEEAQAKSFPYLYLGFASMGFVMHLVLPRLVSRTSIIANIENYTAANQNPDNDSREILIQSLAGTYQTKTIVACAILESTAFLMSYAYMATKELIFLIVALTFIALILFRFPTVSRVANWIEQVVRENELEQQFNQH